VTIAFHCNVHRGNAPHDDAVLELRARPPQEQVAISTNEGSGSSRKDAGTITVASAAGSSSSGDKVSSKEGGEAASAGDVVAQVDAAVELNLASHPSDNDPMDTIVGPVYPLSPPTGKHRGDDMTGQCDKAGQRVTNRTAVAGAMTRRSIFEQLRFGAQLPKPAPREGNRKGTDTKEKKGKRAQTAEDEASVDSQSRSLSSVSESESIEANASRVCGKRQREVSGRGRNLKKTSDSVPVIECEESRATSLAYTDKMEVALASAGETRRRQEVSSGSGPAVDTCRASVSGEGAGVTDSVADSFMNGEANDVAHSYGPQPSSAPVVAPVSAPDVRSPAVTMDTVAGPVVTVNGVPDPIQPSSLDPIAAPVSAPLPASTTAATSGATPQGDGAQGVQRKLEAQIAGVLEALGKLHSAPDSAVVKKMKADLESRLESLSHALHRLAAKEDAELLREAERYW
jgi:hypothetical protein